ncbi:MAG: phosphatidate cytidylyltransferase [Rhodospirillaceae bacterium]
MEHDKLGNLRARALSAAVLGPLVLGAVYAGGWLFQALIGAGAVLAVREWVRMVAPLPAGRSFLISSCVAIGLIVATYLFVGPIPALALAFALAPALGLIAGFCRAGLSGVDRRVGAFAIPYIGTSSIALMWLRDGSGGTIMICFLLLSVWANDIGGYVVGRSVGGPKLAPSISPAKTWSGFIGGVIASAMVGGGLAVATGAHHPLVAVALGIVLAVVGQGGDLLESAVKRRYGVKDSGGLIPGHGGLLDRIDGLLAAAPALALFHAAAGSTMAWW